MMFMLAGIISFKMLPADRSKRYFSKDGKGGISCKLAGAISMALFDCGVGACRTAACHSHPGRSDLTTAFIFEIDEIQIRNDVYH